ncbi:hypothetical protein HanPI659440_Chr01g0006451 [Helianthus annuus]|nr:hypothetical protein HanPI659440_Chr01g0006451 [Helianthus annuus]
MVSSLIPDPPGFYRLCIVVPSSGCRVGFSPELVAWWARGSVRAGWAAAGYLSANGCRVRSTRQFLCWTLKKKKTKQVFTVMQSCTII